MRNSILYGAFALLMFSITINACKKKEEPEITPQDCSNSNTCSGFNPTPYELQQPAYFSPIPSRITSKKLTVEGIKLGRHLFYEKLLSGDNTMSCASCHNQANGFTDNGKAFSEGIDGSIGTINAMPLFNLAYSAEFFWDGRSPTIEAQALEPVINPIEMHETWKNAINELKGVQKYNDMFCAAYGTLDYDSTHAADAIAQFELTLISAGSEFDKALERIGGANIDPIFASPSVVRGYKVFTSEVSANGGGGDCFHCHSVDNRLFTNNEFMNNGLDDNPDIGRKKVTGKNSDLGKFKVPSLRNIEHTGPFMHDGRFKTLEEVVEFYNSGVKINSPNIEAIMLSDNVNGGTGIANGLNLKLQEKIDLVNFLKALSDPDFISNPEFSDPNK